VTNAGGAQTYGIEMDVAWKPLEELTVGIAYAWTHAQWTDYNLAKIRDDAAQGPFGTPPSESIKARDRANCQNPQRDCSGAPISGIPEHAASFTANYTSRLTDSIDWFTSFTMEFEGKRALQEWKNAPYVGSYFIENLQAGVQTEDWSVQLYVDNLLDNNAVRWAQVYQDFRDGMYGGGSGGEPRDVTVYAFLPPPRVFGVRATYHFGAK
jgi:iron complex outermembrane receptor protein